MWKESNSRGGGGASTLGKMHGAPASLASAHSVNVPFLLTPEMKRFCNIYLHPLARWSVRSCSPEPAEGLPGQRSYLSDSHYTTASWGFPVVAC